MGSKLALTFRIYKQGQLVRTETLTQGVIKLGKVASAHLQLDDESVSRMHAILEVTSDQVSLIDLGSTRGTFVNGQRINKATLQSGDTITVGDVRVEVEFAAVALAPPVPTVTQTMPPPVPMARPAAPAVFAQQADEEVGAARAVEVATMLGDSVINVKHCMNPRSTGKVTMKTWGMFAMGAACLLSSGIAFASSVSAAARNKEALAYHTNVLKKPEYAFRAAPTPPALPIVAFGGLALGLIGMTAGLVRARNDKKSPYYRVGTAPGVEQPLETAPAADFPLVAPSGDDFVFNYGAGIDGEIIVDGRATPLAELAATGRARPSLTTAGAIEVPIPPKARIRARSGNTTFLVSAVAQPKTHAVPFLAGLEARTLGYVAGSLAVHMGIWAVLNQMPADDMGANIDLGAVESTDIRAASNEKEETPPEHEVDPDNGLSGDTEGMGKAGMGLEGASGKPDAKSADGHIRIADNQKPHALSRAEAIKAAQEAGILGSVPQLTSAITALASEYDYSSGFDTENIHGPMFGAEGEGKGVFGGGRMGFGGGGGCALPPCGIIGTGKYGTIGTGEKAGDGWGGPGDGKGPMRKRTAAVPTDIIGRPIIGGDLDKDIIRRYIKRSIQSIAYCYEKQLLATPGLEGTVTVQFLIAPNGTVQAANGSGLNSAVSSCVASIVSNIKFPAPKNGGTVQVNYPFNFRAPR